MMTSWNSNTVRIIIPLRWEFTRNGWIPLPKGQPVMRTFAIFVISLTNTEETVHVPLIWFAMTPMRLHSTEDSELFRDNYEE